MTHRQPEPAEWFKPAKAPRATTDVSNWWYAVGALVGVLAVFVFWWFVFPTIVSLFY